MLIEVLERFLCSCANRITASVMVTERVGRNSDSASVQYLVATDLWEARFFFCISISVILDLELFVLFVVPTLFCLLGLILLYVSLDF